MGNILNTFGFDGIDIDLEGSSVTVTGGTIQSIVDAKIINLIDEGDQTDYGNCLFLCNAYEKLMLTMAPKRPLFMEGCRHLAGARGAYLPLIHALRDSIDILHVQLYNSGSMYGIDPERVPHKELQILLWP